jgi:branched-chain amino acid transport system substrate-binding protein
LAGRDAVISTLGTKQRCIWHGKRFRSGPAAARRNQEDDRDDQDRISGGNCAGAFGGAGHRPKQKTVKIGFISTFSGPTAVIGNDMRNAFELALDHLGRKLGGLPVEVIYEDDQQKPDVGVQKTQKLIESDHVDFVVGYIWSNVLLASLPAAGRLQDHDGRHQRRRRRQLAGELCSPYVFSTSWQNDQTPAAMGLYMNQKGVKSAFLIGPNYAAGKDMLAGVKITFKGQIVGEEYTLARPARLLRRAVKSARIEARSIFVFYPGGAGVQFVTQYTQSGSRDKSRSITGLHHRRAVDTAAEGSAIGVPGAQEWVNDLPNEPTRNSSPITSPNTTLRPSYYGAQTYDAAGLINSAITAVKGDLSAERRHAQGDGKGRLQVGARPLHLRQQPHADRELLSAGCGEAGRRLRAQDGGDHCRERSGPLPRQMPDEIGSRVVGL